jgi:hypothetical protein
MNSGWGRKLSSQSVVVLGVYATGGEDKVQKTSMKRFGAAWKVAGPKSDSRRRPPA